MRSSPSLPLAPLAALPRHRLPLADAARPADRAARPSYAIWEVTLRCDLACTHCSSRAGRARADELSTREALDLVGQLAELGVLEVTLIGGEAYLREDWTEIVRAIRDQGMECTMVTGGRSFTPERARAAKEAGLMSVSVSIDGTPATHDALRGWRGSHAAAMASMRGLADAGVQVSAQHADRAPQPPRGGGASSRPSRPPVPTPGKCSSRYRPVGPETTLGRSSSPTTCSRSCPRSRA